MTKTLSDVVLGIGITFLLSGVTRDVKAISRPQNPPVARVDLIDMAKAFGKSQVFERKRAALKQEIMESEVKAKSIQVDLERLTKKLESLERGSEDHAEALDAMRKKLEEFQVFRRTEGARYLRAESAIYREVYDLVSAEVANYAHAHEIDLVVRFSADPVKDEEPQKLLQSLNRLIVYEAGLDITDDIIAVMKAANL